MRKLGRCACKGACSAPQRSLQRCMRRARSGAAGAAGKADALAPRTPGPGAPQPQRGAAAYDRVAEVGRQIMRQVEAHSPSRSEHAPDCPGQSSHACVLPRAPLALPDAHSSMVATGRLCVRSAHVPCKCTRPCAPVPWDRHAVEA
jgi:hypothetical protein